MNIIAASLNTLDPLLGLDWFKQRARCVHLAAGVFIWQQVSLLNEVTDARKRGESSSLELSRVRRKKTKVSSSPDLHDSETAQRGTATFLSVLFIHSAIWAFVCP